MCYISKLSLSLQRYLYGISPQLAEVNRKLQNNMQNTKEIQSQNRYLVRRVSLTDSLKSIPAGVTVTYDCREAGSMASAKSAVSRLNKAAGREEYKVTSTDNGVTYSVTHNE